LSSFVFLLIAVPFRKGSFTSQDARADLLTRRKPGHKLAQLEVGHELAYIGGATAVDEEPSAAPRLGRCVSVERPLDVQVIAASRSNLLRQPHAVLVRLRWLSRGTPLVVKTASRRPGRRNTLIMVLRDPSGPAGTTAAPRPFGDQLLPGDGKIALRATSTKHQINITCEQ
jgi:hypothetical protein